MFVSKKKYDELHSAYDVARGSLQRYKEDYAGLLGQFNDLKAKSEEQQNEIDRLNELTIIDNSTGGSVTLKVAKDLESVQPIVKYNPDMFEKLVELQYLDDTHQNNKFAIQLALMQVSFEALTQIIESFESSIDE
jgi:hypothetical protein